MQIENTSTASKLFLFIYVLNCLLFSYNKVLMNNLMKAKPRRAKGF